MIPLEMSLLDILAGGNELEILNFCFIFRTGAKLKLNTGHTRRSTTPLPVLNVVAHQSPTPPAAPKPKQARLANHAAKDGIHIIDEAVDGSTNPPLTLPQYLARAPELAMRKIEIDEDYDDECDCKDDGMGGISRYNEPIWVSWTVQGCSKYLRNPRF